MQNPWVYKHLVEWMDEVMAPPEAIQAFKSYWETLGEHDGLPCPNCFMDGVDKKLISREETDDGDEPLLCQCCDTQYYIPKN